MAFEVILPKQGWSAEEAQFVAWLKQPGESVKAGEVLFSVETEKAVQEIEALDSGILHLLPNGPQPGDTVKIAQVIGYLLAPGENAPAGESLGGGTRSVASAVEQQPRQSVAVQRDQTAGTRVTGGRAVSPRAARRAIATGADLRNVTGSGKGGRIREADVVAAIPKESIAGQPIWRPKQPGPSPIAPIPAPPVAPPIPGRPEKITTLRRTVADRMHRSKTLTAPVTLTTRADAGALVKLREGLKAKGKKTVPAYGDIIMREVAQALLEHPALNARWEEDHIRYPESVNIGFAVDTEAGLVVPVVRDAAKLALPELADLTRDLAERAKSRRLSVEEMSGGTFTITNLGMAGIDAFTPIVNWPECAVLGVGRITKEPVANGKQVVVGDRLWLSLTFDHRIVDGAPAARFLDALSKKIETVA